MHFRLDGSRCTSDYAYSTPCRCTSDSIRVDALPTRWQSMHFRLRLLDTESMDFRLDQSRCTPDYAYSTSSRCTSDSMTVYALPTTLTRHRYDALSTRRYPIPRQKLR